MTTRDAPPGRRSRLRRMLRLLWNLAGVAALAIWVTGYLYLRHRATRADATDIAAQRAPAGGLWFAQRVETSLAERKMVVLRNGSRVEVRPGSRLTYQYAAPFFWRGAAGTLDGEAAIALSVPDREFALTTWAGRVRLTPGRYAVRCEPGCAAMLVTVGVGFAHIPGDSAGTGVWLTDGEHARVRRGRRPEIVHEWANSGYPVPEVGWRAWR